MKIINMTKAIPANDKEFKEFMLSDFDNSTKYQEVMRQWANQSCQKQFCYVVKESSKYVNR